LGLDLRASFTSWCINNLFVISEQCQADRCDECPKIFDLGNGSEKCGCKHHLNTLDTSATMNESLRRQLDEQDKIETITPNEPHIA
jgi:hypothetical protein